MNQTTEQEEEMFSHGGIVVELSNVGSGGGQEGSSAVDGGDADDAAGDAVVCERDRTRDKYEVKNSLLNL